MAIFAVGQLGKMVKGKPDPNWKQKFLEYTASGKSSLAWSKENNIPYTPPTVQETLSQGSFPV